MINRCPKCNILFSYPSNAAFTTRCPKCKTVKVHYVDTERSTLYTMCLVQGAFDKLVHLDDESNMRYLYLDELNPAQLVTLHNILRGIGYE